MKKTIVSVLALAASVSLLFAAGGKDAGSASASKYSGTYTFGGSTTVQPIANVAIEQFTKANPGVKISYEGVGSGTGIKQLGEGTLSLAGSSRELKQAELDLGLVPVVIARDSITPVVNKDCTVANLTKDQLAGIYAGTITNWKDVGGKDEVIVVVNRDETSGTFSSFKELVLDPSKLSFTKNAIVAKENGEVAARSLQPPAPSDMSDSAMSRKLPSPAEKPSRSTEFSHRSKARSTSPIRSPATFSWLPRVPRKQAASRRPSLTTFSPPAERSSSRKPVSSRSSKLRNRRAGEPLA